MKTILITGASRGIGAAIARKFAAGGYHTVITCKNSKEELFARKAELEDKFRIPCTAIVCDMGNYQAVEALFSSIPAPDVLINNAGVSYFGLLSEMSVEDWEAVIHTNLSACFYTCKLALPAMVRRQAGHILNISSAWGACGSSLETAYSASKGGVNAFTKALAKELAPSNIQVNAIAPGVIDTAMNGCLSFDDRENLRAEIPADRFGLPDEVADLAWQIVHAPAYMTGQIIGIDGGWQ